MEWVSWHPEASSEAEGDRKQHGETIGIGTTTAWAGERGLKIESSGKMWEKLTSDDKILAEHDDNNYIHHDDKEQVDVQKTRWTGNRRKDRHHTDETRTGL